MDTKVPIAIFQTQKPITKKFHEMYFNSQQSKRKNYKTIYLFTKKKIIFQNECSRTFQFILWSWNVTGLEKIFYIKSFVFSFFAEKPLKFEKENCCAIKFDLTEWNELISCWFLGL